MWESPAHLPEPRLIALASAQVAPETELGSRAEPLKTVRIWINWREVRETVCAMWGPQVGCVADARCQIRWWGFGESWLQWSRWDREEQCRLVQEFRGVSRPVPTSWCPGRGRGWCQDPAPPGVVAEAWGRLPTLQGALGRDQDSSWSAPRSVWSWRRVLMFTGRARAWVAVSWESSLFWLTLCTSRWVPGPWAPAAHCPQGWPRGESRLPLWGFRLLSCFWSDGPGGSGGLACVCLPHWHVGSACPGPPCLLRVLVPWRWVLPRHPYPKGKDRHSAVYFPGPHCHHWGLPPGPVSGRGQAVWGEKEALIVCVTWPPPLSSVSTPRERAIGSSPQRLPQDTWGHGWDLQACVV